VSDPFTLPGGIDPRADLELALRATRAAAEAVLPAFRAGGEVRYKTPDQPVTEADLLADRMLREALLGERPGYGWLSEETADSPGRLACEAVWIVDPIDGTNSFVAGYPEWVISVALAVRGVVVAGVVHNPATGEVHHALRGEGAFLGGDRIHVSATPPEAPARTVLASRSEMRGGELAFFADRWTLEPLGSCAYKMVKVADGRGDVFVSRSAKSEWDVAAASLIVAEAGGRATDARGGELRFNRPDPHVAGIAVTNGILHPVVMESLARLPG
jgi:myo-inositol-1(or 4)-monophosphatase